MTGSVHRGLAISLTLMIVGTAVGLGLGYWAWGLGAPSARSSKLVIAIQPTQAVSEIASRSDEVKRFLEQRVGLDVNIYVPTSYSAVVEALRFRNADAAFMSAWPAYIANRLAGAEVALAEVREVNIGEKRSLETYYFSYFVVLKDSPYAKLEDLRGKRFAAPSPLSTSGYVVPLARLVELGLVARPDKGEADPRHFFAEVIFAGGYGQAWEALKRGQADVTVIAGDVSEKLYREVLEKTKILERQGPIPSHAVVLRRDLPQSVKSKLIEALLELGDPNYRSLMRSFISGIFVGFEKTSAGKHIEGLRKALELTGLSFTEKLG